MTTVSLSKKIIPESTSSGYPCGIVAPKGEFCVTFFDDFFPDIGQFLGVRIIISFNKFNMMSTQEAVKKGHSFLVLYNSPLGVVMRVFDA